MADEMHFDPPELQNFRRWMLGTKDAYNLYEQVGFVRAGNSERIMRLGLLDEYAVVPGTEDQYFFIINF